MPDSPLLTPEAAAEVSAVLADLVVNDPHDVEFVPLLGTIGSPQAVGNHLARAFLAAHDPEALAERVAKTLPTADLPEFSTTWADDPLADEWAHLARAVIDRLGLGGDDA